MDLCRPATFILPVIPFHQVRISFGNGAKPGQFTRSGRALQRTGKYPGKGHALEALTEPPGVALAICSERQVGKASMLAREAPCSFAVTCHIQHWKYFAHAG